MFFGLLLLLLSTTARWPATAHPDMGDLPINPALGVPGFPNCRRAHPNVRMTVPAAARDLVCAQRDHERGASVKIGCVGDSITAGVHSSGGVHPYPQQLQLLLDADHGEGAYSVTNLGACGSTMLKKSNSPYWERPQYQTLTNNSWDIVTIMLGTNDAKDPGSGGPPNWLHNCGGADHTTLDGCTFAEDYTAMIEVIARLGESDKAPQIFVMVPPPLMQEGSIGANQTVINNVYSKLLPQIQQANKNVVVSTIDVFHGMGGEEEWRSDPQWPKSCQLNSDWRPCKWWCDEQSCDQCHPNDNGYTHLAKVLQEGLGL